MIASALIGIALKLFEAFVKKGALNSLLTVLLCCGAGGVLSNLTVLIGLGHHADLISIGNIMLLIPGIAFTNSLRDMFSGDTLTGLIRVWRHFCWHWSWALVLRWRICCFNRTGKFS